MLNGMLGLIVDSRGIMTSQQRRERKTKKREKIRLLHLKQTKSRAEKKILNYSLDVCKMEDFNKPPVQARDVKEETREEMLGFKPIMLKALQTAKSDKQATKILTRLAYASNRITKKDIRLTQRLLTEAAREICCDPPYFIPSYAIKRAETGGAVCLLRLHSLKKLITPVGSAWYVRGRTEVAFQNKRYPFLFSSHAVDRLTQRIDMCNKQLGRYYALTLLTNVWRTLYYEDAFTWRETNGEDRTVVSVCCSLPLPFGLITSRPGVKLGYCPVDKITTERGDILMAKTFLIPTMRGTPEATKLKELGHEALNATTMEGLYDVNTKLKENGFALELVEVDHNFGRPK